jgi:hypothetical protein
MRSGKVLATLLLAALTGCGGGYVSVGIGTFFNDEPSFIVWAGNGNGDVVVDANNHVFAFYDDNGCLYNFQTRHENRNFCLTATGDTAQYGGVLVRIANVRAATGACVTALIDPVTARFVDIETDAFGRESVLVTSLQPQLCIA